MIRRLLHSRLIGQVLPVLRLINRHLPPIVASRIYTVTKSKATQDSRTEHFEKVFEQIAPTGFQGDYLEFGVYQGRMFIVATELAKKYGLNQMRFFAFDSFQGLPVDEGKAFQAGRYTCSRDMFTDNIRRVGVDMRRVKIVEGLYDDSLHDGVKRDHNLESAAIVFVDCDLYYSAKSVLEFLDGVLHPGSIIIFDDWFSFDESGEELSPDQYGEQKAFREWPLHTSFEPFIDDARLKSFKMVAR